ncbi:hypothetical protein ACTXIU_13035 [Glutamicibacter arilaitensis]|uniref:hypothetical protein n=1 Tax=Glutamicibacter arilaitensis TaxID=256701 RepID=UPI003FD64770
MLAKLKKIRTRATITKVADMLEAEAHASNPSATITRELVPGIQSETDKILLIEKNDLVLIICLYGKPEPHHVSLTPAIRHHTGRLEVDDTESIRVQLTGRLSVSHYFKSTQEIAEEFYKAMGTDGWEPIDIW